MKSNTYIIGKRIKEQRKKLGLTQTEIKSAVGISSGNLSDIENGNREKAIERLQTARKGFFSPLNYATPEKIDEKLAELGKKE